MANRKFSTFKMVFVGVMAAVVCVVTLFRFPFLGSKVHFANAMCLLAGLLFGPVLGGLSAGFGSALYDGLLGGYSFDQVLITFVSKFVMAWLCAKIAYARNARAEKPILNIAACVAGALSYVVLYMAKTFVYQHFIGGIALDATFVVMAGKLPASLINAVFAMIAAPVLYTVLRPALKRAGILARIED